MMIHGSLSCDEDRFGPPEQPSVAQCRASHPHAEADIRSYRSSHAISGPATRSSSHLRARGIIPSGFARTRKPYPASVAYKSDLTGDVPGLGCPFQEGLFLKLDMVDGRWWCGFEPYTFVQIPRPEAAEGEDVGRRGAPNADPMGVRPDRGGDPAGDWRRERWAQRYNRNWAGIIDAWARLLTDGGAKKRAFGLERGAGIDALFEVSPITGWSRPGHHHGYFDRTT